MKDARDAPRPKFEPNSIGKSYWRIRIRQALTLPLRHTGSRIICAVALYLAVYNIGVRLWKGPEHPVNRFRWRLLESTGNLPSDLAAKKAIVNKYYEARIFGDKNVSNDTR